VTAEVGDTWIHGPASDVTRLADYRAALRARRAFCGGGAGGPPPRGCSGADDPGGASGSDAAASAVDEFSRMIAKVPEHTWGVAFGPYFGDFTNYTNAWLHDGIGWMDEEGGGGGGGRGGEEGTGRPFFKPDAELAPNYAAVVRSWRRQYRYLEAARRALMAPTARPAAGALAAPHPILEAWDADVAERAALAADEVFAREAAAAMMRGEVAVDADGRGPLPRKGLDALDLPADGKWRPVFVARARGGSGGGSGSGSGSGSDRGQPPTNADADDCAPFPIKLVHWTLAFDRCTGGLTSLRRRRWDGRGRELPPGAEWAGGPAAASASAAPSARPAHFAELRYDVYGEEDYEPTWKHYAYVRPVWVGDFGKLNLTDGLQPPPKRRRVVGAVPALAASFFRRDPPSAAGGGASVRLVLRFADDLVREAGAPRQAWVDIREPSGDGNDDDDDDDDDDDRRRRPPPRPLVVAAVWRRKTPTRRPEALWLRFAPGSGAAVDAASWRLSKVGGGGGASGSTTDGLFTVSPFDVAVNGSHAMHAVSDDGVAVRSSPGGEVLRIGTLDAALVAAGAPRPFPVPRRAGTPPPDLAGEGISYCAYNNVWGTNWPMWSPWRAREVDAAFRFVLTAEREGGGRGGEAERGAQI